MRLATMGSLALAGVVAAACSGSVPPSPSSAATHSEGQTSAPESFGQPVSQPTPPVMPLDLTTMVISPESPPNGMTSSSAGEGREVLSRLPLSPETSTQLQAVQGFMDGRYSDFAGSSEDFEASKGFILTWVAQYASPGNAADALSILLNELQSDDGYGWDISEDPGLGDQGTCSEGENPQLGGLQGVRRRLSAFDGTVSLTSPAGGPTIVTMEIPCELSSAKTTPSFGTD
jgi:hypothetical protein